MNSLRQLAADIVVAFQFLTHIPTPQVPFADDSLSRATLFFPLVGLALGAASASLHCLLVPHLTRGLAALSVILFLALITGGLHEDGLADTADGFGGGRTRERILAILHDSRIGSYGALAIVFSVAARTLLIAAIPLDHITPYLIAAPVLSRWSSLPLSLLPPARTPDDAKPNQGARIAQKISRTTISIGTLIALIITIALLHNAAIAPIGAAIVVTLLSARFYQRRIGGVTGDCFGATIQLTEIAVLCCGAWTR